MATAITENLTSQVGGGNLTFTTSSNLTSVILVNFDGSPYFDYTASGTTLTLSDAPTDSLYVTYFSITGVAVSGGIMVSDAIARLQRQFDDDLGEISQDLYLDWLNDLNFMIYREFYNRNSMKLLSSTTITVTSGVDTYALPVDFKNIKPLACGLYNVDSNNRIESQQLIQTGFGSKLKGYFVQGTNIVFTPFPDTSDTFVLKYIPKLAKLTAVTDEMVISEEDLITVINWLDKNYGQWNIDIIKENNADQRFARDLARTIDDFEDVAGVFTLNK